MARTRRKIVSGKVYEIIPRISNKLPLIPYQIINLIIKSALARTQRDDKLSLCHYLWMSNHGHLIVVAQDPQQCINFYQELQKKITESLKRLTGLEQLNLWDGSPVVAEILDIEKAIDKIAYIYANPCSANLVDTVTQYPGVSSYYVFDSIENTTECAVTNEVPWIRLNTIERLSTLKPSRKQDKACTNKLIEKSTVKHDLTLEPNTWMRSFGIETAEEVANVNKRIIERIKEKEQAARDKRVLEKKSVLGVNRLLQQAILTPCISKKKERRVFFYSSIKELRISFLAEFREFVSRCNECYQLLKKGVLADWPPGAFRPPAPPLACAIA